MPGVSGYLHKRISFPSGQVSVLRWNLAQEWLAVGTDTGVLKLLKFESFSDSVALNQTVDTVHSSRISVTAWNEPFRKLLSADSSGLVVVWSLARGLWTEEMRNSRSAGVVAAQWTSDGQRVLVLYADGHLLCGGVDGKRHWTRDVSAAGLRGVQWSPAGNFILLWTSDSGLIFEATQGDYSHRLFERQGIVACQWLGNLGILVASGNSLECFPSEAAEDCVRLASGFARILDLAIIDDDTLAVSTAEPALEVQLFDVAGNLLRSLRLPVAGSPGLLGFDGRRRLAVGVDNFLYFATVHRKFLFAAVEVEELAFSEYPNELTLNGVTRPAVGLRFLVGGGGLFVTANDVTASSLDDRHGSTVTLFNSLGCPLDLREFGHVVRFLSMVGGSVIVVGFSDSILFWPLTTSSTLNTTPSERWFMLDRCEFVTSPPVTTPSSSEAITSLATSPGGALLLTTSRGRVFLLNTNTNTAVLLPAVARTTVRCFVNLDSSLTAFLDVSGGLTVLRVPAGSGGSSTGSQVLVERKDVWDFIFSGDTASMFAFTEKNRTYIFRGDQPDQEPLLNADSAYLVSMENLELTLVKAVSTACDAAVGGQGGEAVVVKYELKRLREARDILEKVRNFKDAEQYVSDNPHPRIWRQLIESCLGRDDLATAERGFVELGEYGGVQFVKRLKTLSADKRRAEIFVYQGKYDEAEKEYLSIGRADLAAEMRAKIGDWFRVAQLKTPDANVHKEIAQYLADRGRWVEAAEAFSKGRDRVNEIHALINAGELGKVAQIVLSLDFKSLEGSKEAGSSSFANEVGCIMEKSGFCEAAVKCYLSAGAVTKALDCCVALNDWERAISLSRDFKLQQTETLLAKYVAHLVAEGQEVLAAQVWVKAGRATEAARVLVTWVKRVGKTDQMSAVLKKTLVTVGLLVDKDRNTTLAGAGATTMAGGTMSGAAARGTILQTLVSQERSVGRERLVEQPWRAAEAVHLYGLANKFLIDGKYEAALRCAVRATEYEDVFEEIFGSSEPVWSCYCLSGLLTGQLLQASKALIRLEQMDGKWKKTAISVFKHNLPRDSTALRAQPCPQCRAPVEDHEHKCGNCGEKFPFCVASGKTVLSLAHAVACKGCRHRVLERGRLVHCPLCHTKLPDQA